MMDKVNLAMHNNNTVAEITFALTQELSNEKVGQAAMLLWSIWKSWNLRVWQNVTESVQAISMRARQVLSDWNDANNMKNHSGVTGNSVAANSANHLQTVAALGAVTAQILLSAQVGRNRIKVGLSVR